MAGRRSPAGRSRGDVANGCDATKMGGYAMSVATVSGRMLDVAAEMRAVTAFGQRVLEGRLGPDACDFMFGNPQEPPLRGLVEAIIRHAEPHDVHWFGYQKYDQSARDAVARSLCR